MEPKRSTLRMFGTASDVEPLAWDSVDGRLRDADTYWVIARSSGHPHPRPVWGVWLDDRLLLSLGSPVVRRSLADDATVTVHLDSGLEPVIVEGRADGSDRSPEAIAAYDAKYDWSYDADRYGPFTVVQPSTVLSWRAVGPAGRDGFRQGGRWTY